MSEYTFDINESEIDGILPKGRYKAKVVDVEEHLSKANNKCFIVHLQIGDTKIKEYLIPRGKMEWKWKRFVYACGFYGRFENQSFEEMKSKLVGKEVLTDVIIKEKASDDGYIIKQNSISYFVKPKEEEVAPIVGVPPEDEEEI